MSDEMLIDLVASVIESADEIKEKPINDLQDYG